MLALTAVYLPVLKKGLSSASNFVQDPWLSPAMESNTKVNSCFASVHLLSLTPIGIPRSKHSLSVANFTTFIQKGLQILWLFQHTFVTVFNSIWLSRSHQPLLDEFRKQVWATHYQCVMLDCLLILMLSFGRDNDSLSPLQVQSGMTTWTVHPVFGLAG